MEKIQIEILELPTEQDLEQINALIPQIARKPRLLSMEELWKIVDQKENCKVVVARDISREEKPIVGMAVVTLLWIPTGGPIAMVEDVVVDENWRGLKIGKMLNEKLIEIALLAGAKHISLYTNKKRVEANEMYAKLGYKKLEDINFYRINFEFQPSHPEEVAQALSKRVKRKL